jgi:hypothetical protein
MDVHTSTQRLSLKLKYGPRGGHEPSGESAIADKPACGLGAGFAVGAHVENGTDKGSGPSFKD